MNDLRPTIVRLLSNMASAKEIQQYLKRFSQIDAARFAVVKVGGAILRDDLEALVSSLAFLQQVGLTPIVVHGAGPQLDVDMQAAGIEKRTVNGLRYTSPEGLAVVRRVSQRENLLLVEALQAQGVRATSITAGVFEADYLGKRTYGLVGKVVAVHTAAIDAAIKVGSIPVITALAETTGGQILNVNADWAANELVKTLQPYKIIFLTGTGGLLDGEGKVIDSINLSTEYAELIQQPWLHSGMKVKIEQIHALLMQLPPSSSVSITRPDELEGVRRVSSWKKIDLMRLKSLIESGFGRKLTLDYFDRIKPWRVYVSEHYRAALILTLENGVPHLDKFAVSDDAQGEGLGRAAWLAMRSETPRLFWRARPGNAINDFYFSESDGCMKGDKWNVYWYGLDSFDEVRTAIEHCRSRPATLKK